MNKASKQRGYVVTYPNNHYPNNVALTEEEHSPQAHSPAPPQSSKKTHENVTRAHMAEKLAALKGFEFAGEYNAKANYAGSNIYFVPADTLLHTQARQLNIHSEENLFGGIVELPFMATKSITHPLVDTDAVAPAGWTPRFANNVAKAVLRGYTVFSIADAQRAAVALLKKSAVRVKPALGIGGCGQTVVTDIDQLLDAINVIDRAELALYGVALEQNLDQVVTYSVGQVYVAGLRITYYGTQGLTRNHRGENVYGGSTLHIVRGNFEALKRMPLPPAIRLAVDQGCCYDAAANANFSGLLASRRNYDIVQGLDECGTLQSGVLEQSWRIGGASPAEIAALEAFSMDPELLAVKASSCEVYDILPAAHSSHIYYQGVDENVGALTKYSTIDCYEYSTE
ncbi:MAG: biotin carboxylase [Verrucomicrobiaceae bacterium]|nr:biotin carboxylase [Verrucomicrobiaceae bacterium]